MIEVLKQALEALEECRRDPRLKYEHPTFDKAITSLRQAIAELESQEPVATVTSETGNPDVTMSWWHEPPLPVGTSLYTAPPKREWVGLTGDELADLWYKESLDWMEFARAHEAALKEKNR